MSSRRATPPVSASSTRNSSLDPGICSTGLDPGRLRGERVTAHRRPVRTPMCPHHPPMYRMPPNVSHRPPAVPARARPQPGRHASGEEPVPAQIDPAVHGTVRRRIGGRGVQSGQDGRVERPAPAEILLRPRQRVSHRPAGVRSPVDHQHREVTAHRRLRSGAGPGTTRGPVHECPLRRAPCGPEDRLRSRGEIEGRESRRPAVPRQDVSIASYLADLPDAWPG